MGIANLQIRQLGIVFDIIFPHVMVHSVAELIGQLPRDRITR